ncbi:unnamed protein product, partial [Heterobilharzia americana]
YTQFKVNAVLYNSENGKHTPWSDDYNNYSSAAYLYLAAQFCTTIRSSLLIANTPIFQGTRCITVIFIRISLFIRSKRQISSINNTNNADYGVQGSTLVELQTLPASQLSQSQFSEFLVSGYNQLNKTSGALLNNLESSRK